MLFRAPTFEQLMLYAKTIENFTDDKIDQLRDRLRLLIKGWHRRQDQCSGLLQTQQVFEMELIERGFARHQ